MTPIQRGARYGAYHRVSQGNGRDVEDETTITDKEAWAKIDGWAEPNGIQITERYLDWDRTGSKLERPELDRMLADLRAGRIDGIAVAKTNRLSRAKTGDALRLVGEIQETKPGCLALLDLGVDPTTPVGELMLTMLLAFARMEWRNFQEAWAAAQARAVKRGAWLAPTPLGYRKTVIGHTRQGKPIYGPLELDPVIWMIMRDAFRLAAAEGLHAAMAHLQAKVPDRRWRTTDVRRILSNRAYIGEHHAGGEPHPAIIDLPTWTAAQTDSRGKRTTGAYVLSGVATCARCDAPLVGAGTNVRGKPYRRYRCSSPGCRGGSSIAADRLDGYVRAELQEAIDGGRLRMRHVGADVDALEAAMVSDKAEVQRWAEDTEMRGILGDEAHRAGARARATRAAESLAAYEAAATSAARSETVPARVDRDEDLLRALRAGRVRVEVRPGRGPVEERVSLFEDVDDDAGVLAA